MAKHKTIKDKNKELAQFQLVAIRLIAFKMLQEYLVMSESGPVEIESFAEHWIKSNVLRPKISMKRNIWRYFFILWQDYLREKPWLHS